MAADTVWPGDTLSALSAWPDVADWGTFQGNAAHTGLVPARGGSCTRRENERRNQQEAGL